MTKNFKDLGLPSSLVEALSRMQITVPTQIQEETIPLAIAGTDILASAQTGSGKTVAYSMPLIMKLMDNPKSRALILTPTRELAEQVHRTLNQILGKTGQFNTVLLIGGASMGKQIGELKRRPQLIVGTPGRINDHLNRRTLALHETRFLIIDEADRMLDMGFGIQLEQIAEYLPEEKQTLMFSATLPPNIDKLTKKYLRNPKRVAVGSVVQAAPKIKQEIMHTSVSEKFNLLLDQLNQREGSVIIFVKTKHGTERLSDRLKEHGHTSDAIHGDLPQRRRERVIQGFRSKKNRIMVATDVAARGLDIPHVMHVINYDLPQCPEDYIHRIGRTGRAGAEGHALCIVSPEDGQKWRAICKLMGLQAPAQEKNKAPFAKPFRGRFKPKRKPFQHSYHRFSRNKQKQKSQPFLGS